MADHNREEENDMETFQEQLLAFGLTRKTVEILLNHGFRSLEDMRCLKVTHLNELPNLTLAQKVKMENYIEQNWLWVPLGLCDERDPANFKEQLFSHHISEETIDVLNNAGFNNVFALRCLEVTDLDTINGLTLAERYILRKNIVDKWAGIDQECEQVMRRITATARNPTVKQDRNANQTKNRDDLSEDEFKSTRNTHNASFRKNDEREIDKENTSQTQNLNDFAQNESRSTKSTPNQPKTRFQQNDESGIDDDRKKSNSSPTSKAKTNSRQTDIQEEPKPSSYQTSGNHRSKEDIHPNIEEIPRPPPSPTKFVQRMKCNLARDYFYQKQYDAMEGVLLDLDEESKSTFSRVRFGGLISKGCNDFSEVHDCLNLQTTDVSAMHEVICQQCIALAESHGTLLNQMGLESENQVFLEWAGYCSAVFDHDSNLEYDSNQWKRVIGKTEELVAYFSSLSTPAQNVTKSFILLILHFVDRVWLVRNDILPSDKHGLLRIATFCIHLCESSLVSSRYFCKIKYNAYAHAAITLGCNIANSRLEVEIFYDHFHALKAKMEEYLNQCLELGVDPPTDDNERNLGIFSSDVETKWANYISTIDPEDEKLPHYPKRDESEQQRMVELQISKLNQLFRDKQYYEMRRSIAESEDMLQETDFKLNIAVSSKFEEIHSAERFNFGSAHELLESLQHNLMDLVIDCKRVLVEMKVYCNDALATWAQLFVTFCSSQDCRYGSAQWKESMAASQIAIDDAPRGIDPNGQMIIQLYLQLVITLTLEVFVAFENVVPDDHPGHVRLAFMNMTMSKSSLLNSKWYSKLKYDVHGCAVRSLADCIVNGNIPADHDTYEQYKHVKDVHDQLDVSCRKLSINAGSKEVREKLKRLTKAVERKVFGKHVNQKVYEARREGHQVNVIGSDPHVSRYIEQAVENYHRQRFDEMTTCLNDAEAFDGKCDVRLAFAGNCSPNFNAAVNFSNNIPEGRGLYVVIKTTYEQLMNLANDHQRSMAFMEESESSAMADLIKYLFEELAITYCSEEWSKLMKKSKHVVDYFESLSPNGKSVTKAYVLLFITILHNFIAVRNRLCPRERYKLLPFVISGVPFCESKMLESDAWINAKFSVYDVTIGTALGAGQIPCSPLFPKYCKELSQLKQRADTLGINVIGKEKEEVLNKIRGVGNELYKGSEDRMCISAAMLYFEAGCYMGMMEILNAGDETSNAVNIRMNFTMRISDEFEACVDYHNQISEETRYGDLINKGYEMLRLASKDHSKFLRRLKDSSSDALFNWVDAVFQARGNSPDVHPDKYGSDEWKCMLEKSRLAGKYIMGLSKVAICVSQAYLSFFMSWGMNFISRRHNLCPKTNDFIGELRLILAVIELCKEAFITSNFSVRMKERAYHLAALLLTQAENTGEAGVKEMKVILKEQHNCKKMINTYDTKLKNRETNRKAWPAEEPYDGGSYGGNSHSVGQDITVETREDEQSKEEESYDVNELEMKPNTEVKQANVVTNAGENAYIVGGDQTNVYNNVYHYTIQTSASTEKLCLLELGLMRLDPTISASNALNPDLNQGPS